MDIKAIPAAQQDAFIAKKLGKGLADEFIRLMHEEAGPRVSNLDAGPWQVYPFARKAPYF